MLFDFIIRHSSLVTISNYFQSSQFYYGFYKKVRRNNLDTIGCCGCFSDAETGWNRNRFSSQKQQSSTGHQNVLVYHHTNFCTNYGWFADFRVLFTQG